MKMHLGLSESHVRPRRYRYRLSLEKSAVPLNFGNISEHLNCGIASSTDESELVGTTDGMTIEVTGLGTVDIGISFVGIEYNMAVGFIPCAFIGSNHFSMAQAGFYL